MDNISIFLSSLSVYTPLLIYGTLTTLFLWVMCSLLSFSIGLVGGILLSNRLRLPIAGSLLEVLVTIFQGIPLYTQLLLAYFVVFPALGLPFSAKVTGIIVLGLCSAAYTTHIIRGSLNAIPIEQWETSFSLGYSLWQQLRFIILPQALINALPALANEVNQILKSTAVLAAIGTVELTKVGLNIIASSLNPLAVLVQIAGIYLVITTLFSFACKKIEQRYQRYV